MRARREGGFNRRDFLKGVGLGVFGAAALGRDLVAGSASGTARLAGNLQAAGQAAPVPRCGRELYAAVDETATVTLVKGNDRRAIVHQSLKTIEDDVFAAIGNKPVMIKPNMCVDKKPLAVTHVDAVRAVIDGFESMEGDGPAWGTPFDSRVAIASLDALAADVVGTTVMGFDAQKILYLSAMTKAGMGQGDMAKIRVLGTPLDQCRYKFKPHKHVAEVYKL